MIVGYARVSSLEQNLDRQLEVFKNLNITQIYADKTSGKNFDREEYQNICSKTLNKHLAGKKTVLNKLNLSIEIIKGE